MLQKQPGKSSFWESLKALEADIQHANSLAAAFPRDYGGDCIQMRLSYSPFAPFILFLIEWMDYRCMDTLSSFLGLFHILVSKAYVDGEPALSSKERKATLREFYVVIYPSLMKLEGEFIELESNNKRSQCMEVLNRNKVEDWRKASGRDLRGMMNVEYAWKTVQRWNIRSQSCPFCRGSLKRVFSTDLWVLTGNNDIIDIGTLVEENLKQLYLYIENPPLVIPDTNSVACDYMY